MSIQEEVSRVLSPHYAGTVEAYGTDAADQIRVELTTRGSVSSITALHLGAELKRPEGLREAILEAGNAAETGRVLAELNNLGALEGGSTAPVHLPPLPGPKAARLVVRTPAEQADHLARYINSGGLEKVEVPGLTWVTSANTYLSIAYNDRGQVADVRADEEWLVAVTIERLNNSLREVIQA